MKHLKYFENKEDLDPFDEEDWEEEEDENGTCTIYKVKKIFNPIKFY